MTTRAEQIAAASRTARKPSTARAAVLVTPDQRYIVVRARLWRAANPRLSARARTALTRELMSARRAVAAANRSGRAGDLKKARARVNAAKIALGERGPVWWKDGSPDYNRHLIKNTPYASWYAALGTRAMTGSTPRRAGRGPALRSTS